MSSADDEPKEDLEALRAKLEEAQAKNETLSQLWAGVQAEKADRRKLYQSLFDLAFGGVWVLLSFCFMVWLFQKLFGSCSNNNYGY